MSTDNIPFFQYEKEKHPYSSQTCSYGIFSKELKNEFERVVVNKPSVFEPLRFYCTGVVCAICQSALITASQN